MAQRASRGEECFEFFPIESTISKDVYKDDKDVVLLIDIGGGLGHDLGAFSARFPKLPGRVVLQYLPHVIESIPDTPDGLEPFQHGFFTPPKRSGA